MSSDDLLIGVAADLREVKADVRSVKTDVGVLKTDVGVLKTDVGVLKTDVGVLKTDVRELKAEVSGVTRTVVALAVDVADLKKSATADRTHNERMFEHLLKVQDETLTLLKQLHASNSALASSVGLAMSELAVARSLERRVDRLEAAVFPEKH